MKINLKKYLNIRLLIILACITIFILINSTQESYFGINDYTANDLTTITPSTSIPSSDPFTSDPSAPPPPTNTPSVPAENPQGGSEALIPAQVIPIAIAIVIIVLIAFLFFRRKAEGSSRALRTSVSGGTLRARREKFRTKIITLSEALLEYLRDGRYTDGIIFGFHQLDENMKKILGISRETYLTPKEFANSLELPNILPHLNSMIQLFYLARYKNQPMKQKDLKTFITELSAIKRSSETQSDIEIIHRTPVSDEQ